MFLPFVSYGQINMVGIWETKEIIGLSNVAEYSLKEQKSLAFGHYLALKNDDTFSSYTLEECLSGCSLSTSGTYKIIDDYHISMNVQKVSRSGLTCGMMKVDESQIIKDLGIFYIYKEGGLIRLIPSNGILQDDKDKMLYTQLLDSFDREWKKYNYVWTDTSGNLPEEIVKDCESKNKLIDLSAYKIVFSKTEGYGSIFLLRQNEDFHYVLYDAFKKKVSLAYPK
ncbi:hypothetical protein [Flavobacterium daemonense]|uniref:hypothetical protein n=1 Tax=Flavobacterium daemonense TaxID=1393049 RepID=UPI001186AA69|nr:hypothetical protein [Flavobacterium daemonense]KAF2330171.1 hypothetical protein FND99_15015 [Flavobacterium daemonense]